MRLERVYNIKVILYDKNIGLKNYICMDEYYVSHFYQMKPTIKHYLI